MDWRTYGFGMALWMRPARLAVSAHGPVTPPADGRGPHQISRQSHPERVVVGAAAHFAVVVEKGRRPLVDGGDGRHAQHRAVALRRRAEDGELGARRRGKGGRHRPAGVSVFAHPAQPQAEAERRAATEIEAAGEVASAQATPRAKWPRRRF